MPRLSLALGVNRASKLPSAAAPSGISLTAPTIYLSGLSFQDQDPYSNGQINNPYNLVSSGYWESAGIGFVIYSAAEWRAYVLGIIEEGGVGLLVATNTAPATSLPTTGWVNTNANLIVSGTLVISTTP